ncbi:MAG: hypothetical protein WBM14_11055 [Terracidiphilus sp.]|jgi:hypothetical protein
MVLVIAQHRLPEPRTDLGCAMMSPALKLSLDGFELRDHPLLRYNSPDDESSVAIALPLIYLLLGKPFAAPGRIVCRVIQSLCSDSAVMSVIDSISKPDELSSEQACLVREHLQLCFVSSRRKQ